MAVVKPFTAPEQRRGPDASDVRTRTADGFVMQRSMAWRPATSVGGSHAQAGLWRKEGGESVSQADFHGIFLLPA